jgi:hypothetical protein
MLRKLINFLQLSFIQKLQNRPSCGTNSTIDSQPRLNVVHYPSWSYFNSKYMWFLIEPDFNTKTINCEQQSKVTILQDLEKIELDCVYNDKQKIEIHLLLYSDAASEEGNKKLSFEQHNDKPSIDAGKKLREGNRFS